MPTGGQPAPSLLPPPRANENKTVVVDVYTTWCGPCKAMSPLLEQWAGEMDPAKVVFAKLNAGIEENKQVQGGGIRIRCC
jgi:thiol-disulfide isomerase/thioredoxin